ncbi:MAG: LapA family protein [Rhizobiaceae bacterium]|nr:LapA family protein [Rhizobiaceae bacterium]
MLNRLVVVVVLVPLAVVLIAFAVANRAAVPMTFDPFNPGNPALTVEWPLFVVLFLALALGLVIGGVATWLGQGRHRKLARQRGIEAEALKQSQARMLKSVPNQSASRP